MTVSNSGWGAACLRQLRRMRAWMVVLLAAMVAAMPTALADVGQQAEVSVPPPPAAVKGKKEAGKPVDKVAVAREALSSLYAGTTSAWFVETRCRLLDKPERRAFEWHMGMLTRALQARGISDRAMAGIQQLAQKDASDPARHACSDAETRAFVLKGLKAARLMVPKLTGLSYDPQNAWLDRHTLIYVLVVTGLAIGDLCPEFMAADERVRFDGYRRDIERRAKANDLSLAQLRAQALRRTASIKACDEQARSAMEQASKLLSEFEE